MSSKRTSSGSACELCRSLAKTAHGANSTSRKSDGAGTAPRYAPKCLCVPCSTLTCDRLTRESVVIEVQGRTGEKKDRRAPFVSCSPSSARLMWTGIKNSGRESTKVPRRNGQRLRPSLMTMDSRKCTRCSEHLKAASPRRRRRHERVFRS